MKINVFLNFLYCLFIVIERTPVDDDVVTIDESIMSIKDSASDPTVKVSSGTKHFSVIA